MTDFSDFKAQIADYANRQDWLDLVVTGFIRQAEQKLNSELRIDRMINQTDAPVTSRCAPLPDDWLQMELVRISSVLNDTSEVPDNFLPIRYKSRDEFFNLTDNFAWGYYTIQGRQIYIGGAPDTVNGQTVRLTYYQEVPVFSDLTQSWIYTKYPSLYLYAALMHADFHAVGEEANASTMKTLCEDMITKLNAQHQLSRASGSRVTRTRTRSFG